VSPKNICLDARMVRASGIGTYLRGLLAGIHQEAPTDMAFTLLGNPSFLSPGPWAVKPVRSGIYSLREQLEIPLAVRGVKSALFHAPHYNVPLALASHSVVTVHDLIHLRFPQYLRSPVARAYAKFYFHHVVPRARKVLTVSENTRRDLIELIHLPPEQIVVTPLAASRDFRPLPQSQVRTVLDKHHWPAQYLLYVGNIKESKNVAFLLDGYRVLKEKRPDIPPLVLVGRGFISGFDQVVARTPGVRWMQECEPGLLPFLYAGAMLFIFPSLYEGFGLPPLEAMACGTPVLCSNRASLPEVVGEAAMLFDPEELDDLIHTMEQALERADLRAELSRKGLRRAQDFSWSALARKTLSTYRECL
jgi:glycosyltransferase involved in cell wall biosynthesis